MAMFAVISGSTVTNVILADTKKIAEAVTGMTCIAADAGIGYSYDETTGEFTAPVVEEVIPPVIEVTE